MGPSYLSQQRSFGLEQVAQAKDVFLITLEAQNLTHLVDPSHVVTDEDLHKAQ